MVCLLNDAGFDLGSGADAAGGWGVGGWGGRGKERRATVAKTDNYKHFKIATAAATCNTTTARDWLGSGTAKRLVLTM